jgi:hypothetical protein
MKQILDEINYLENKVGSVLQLLTLDNSSHQKLLNRFPPKYPRIAAHHVTYYYGSTPYLGMPDISKIKVIGYACDDYIEAAVCEVAGELKSPDGRVFHITISYDPKKRESKDSNKLLFSGNWKKVTPFTIQVTPEKRFM